MEISQIIRQLTRISYVILESKFVITRIQEPGCIFVNQTVKSRYRYSRAAQLSSLIHIRHQTPNCNHVSTLYLHLQVCGTLARCGLVQLIFYRLRTIQTTNTTIAQQHTNQQAIRTSLTAIHCIFHISQQYIVILQLPLQRRHTFRLLMYHQSRILFQRKDTPI